MNGRITNVSRDTLVDGVELFNHSLDELKTYAKDAVETFSKMKGGQFKPDKRVNSDQYIEYLKKIYDSNLKQLKADKFDEIDAADSKSIWSIDTNLSVNFNGPSVDQLKLAIKESIDHESGIIRNQLVSQGNYVDEEYRLAYDEVLEWEAAGSVETDAPDSLVVWADSAFSGDLTAAAEDIKNTRNQWNSVLSAIRTIRLSSKAQVDSASTESEMITIFDNAKQQLQAIVQ